MTQSLTIANSLKYAQLQVAAEAFIRRNGTLRNTGQDYLDALTAGNDRNTKFTTTQATTFAAEWDVVDQIENTNTGFSGTLFKNKNTSEYVISFRSTEFLDDAARDNQATNQMEIAKFGFAFGQLRDIDDWYQSLRRDPSKWPAGVAVNVTGYSLGGHLATAFNEAANGHWKVQA